MKQYISSLAPVLILFLSISLNAQQWITNVTIAPATPSTCDSVMVTVDGDLPATNYSFTSSQFHVSGSFITLNLFYDSQGFGNPTITPFTHTENIGVYVAGSYVLNVVLYFNGNQADQHSSNFTVVQGGTVSVDIGNDTSLCQGQPLTLDATTSNATYLWSTGETSASISVNQTGVYWVDVTVAGCTVRDSVQVTFMPDQPDYLGPDTNLCSGQDLLLDVSLAGGSYSWQDGSSGPTYLVTSSGSYWVDISVGNCIWRDSITVNYHVSPQPDLGPDTSLCHGDSTTLTSGVSNATYQWSTGSTDPAITVHSAGTYWVAATIGSCTGRDTITVDVEGPIDPGLGPDLEPCHGDSVNLVAAVPGATYHWQDGSSSATYEVTASGTYWVEASIGHCSGADTVHVQYKSEIQVDLGTDTVLPAGDTITLDAGSFASYHWSTGDTGRYLEVPSVGTYSVTVSDQTGCEGTGTITIRHPIGLEMTTRNEWAKVYPNPAGNRIFVKYRGTIQGMVLLDGLGRTVRQVSWPLSSPYPLDLTGIPSGMYYLRLIVDDQYHVIPVSKY